MAEVSLSRFEEIEERLFAHYDLDVDRDLFDLGGTIGQVRMLSVGAGTPLVLLHGAGMCAALWAPLLPHLTGWRIHAVDLPGCGGSDPSAYRDGGDLREHATELVAGALDALGLDRAVLVGNSLGGMFALYAAGRLPERVDGLVIVSAPACGFPGTRGNLPMALLSRPRLGAVLAKRAPRPPPALARRVFAAVGGKASTHGHPDDLWEIVAAANARSAATLAGLFPQLMRWRTPLPHVVIGDDELAALDVPTLFIWGDADIFLGPQAGERAVEVMPDARLEVMPGGHHPWLDDAARCAELMRPFLSELPTAAEEPRGGR